MRLVRACMLALVALALALGTTACSGDVAARVNGEVIKKSDWEDRFEALKLQGGFDFEGPGGEATLIEVKQRALDELIDEELLDQEAARRGITVSKTEINNMIEEVQKGFDDEEVFHEALRSQGIEPDDLDLYFYNRLIKERLKASLDTDLGVSDEDVRAYYDSNKKDFIQPAELTVAHILFDLDEMDLAEDILDEVLDGADFGGMAKRHSLDDASKENEGIISSQLPITMEMQAAAESLERGDVFDGIVTDAVGLHIVKLMGRTEERQKSFEESEDEIRGKLLGNRGEDAYYELIQDLRRDADIEVVMQDLKVPGRQSGE